MTGSSLSSGTGPPPLDAGLIAAGQPLYDVHCASCHGIDGTGAEGWKTPNADGTYPPPPHDSTGHTWHHSDRQLVGLIANGSDFAQSRMPAFGDRLSTGEIEAILEYIKTWWGPEERAAQWEITQQEA
ncbi:MAG: cytochrome c [Actinobacteria bacterium]|nr:cytochrome c [Actinomycetota bacterium]